MHLSSATIPDHEVRLTCTPPLRLPNWHGYQREGGTPQPPPATVSDITVSDRSVVQRTDGTLNHLQFWQAEEVLLHALPTLRPVDIAVASENGATPLALLVGRCNILPLAHKRSAVRLPLALLYMPSSLPPLLCRAARACSLALAACSASNTPGSAWRTQHVGTDTLRMYS